MLKTDGERKCSSRVRVQLAAEVVSAAADLNTKQERKKETTLRESERDASVFATNMCPRELHSISCRVCELCWSCAEIVQRKDVYKSRLSCGGVRKSIRAPEFHCVGYTTAFVAFIPVYSRLHFVLKIK